MSANKLQIPLHRFGIAYYDEATFDDPGWQVCDGDAVTALEQAYSEACKERDEARADKRRILDNFATCEMEYKRQKEAMRVLWAFVGLGGGKS